jgi:ABC-type lipoprotein export system ATPase subunit/GNAT superfamily N-acetyltransferase
MEKSIVVDQDEITKEISRSFDYEFNGKSFFKVPKLPKLPDEFGIGLIVGPSGSGKSSILSQFGVEENIEWNPNKAICSHFNNAQEAENRLSAVGFNSIPSWMRPYHVLSTGEKFRVDLAKRLKDNAIIDEFTSVVDRNVAKSCSNAVRRFVDKENLKNVILASCHYDIAEWLQPDWIYDTATEKLSVGRGLVRRPEIFVEIIPCRTEAWAMFCNHHYLTNSINKSAWCWFIIWSGKIIGFTSAISYPSGTVKLAWREHRTVILPDYQGLGIGVKVSDAIGEMFFQWGRRYFSKTSHKRMGEYRNNSINWRPTTHNMEDRSKQYERQLKKQDSYFAKDLIEKHKNRICYCHEYIGVK